MTSGSTARTRAEADDTGARRDAVDPARSVIVQAPAGSGKTTLLVERYLGLLGVVDAPEEILAITFTRKAAAEMKQRILRYLDPAFSTDAAHEQTACEKARAVRERVSEWGLLENPQRLLIRTIDSFNHFLARTMPVATALGPVPAPADNTRALYRQAARQVLSLVDGDDPLAGDLIRLLDWRDHRSQDIEDLLADLLGRREQWLRALGVSGTLIRQDLEAVLGAVVVQQLTNAHTQLDEALRQSGFERSSLCRLLQFAAGNLIRASRVATIDRFAHVDTLPGLSPAELPLWQGLADALLVKGKAQFRQTVNVQQGFPPRTPEKDQFIDLLQALAALPARISPAVALDRVRNLPDPHYQEDEWLVLESLVRVLQRAALELRLVFANSGQMDFSGLAAAALDGLGSEEAGYTDLGLYLDRRIQHILVDEFQDTNWSQLHLLEKLTGGWGPARSEGRSLFLVGDPMQSIYRFREAEVGLFIRTRDQGIGALTLESKTLTRNFRARSEIVTWVNEFLEPVFPTVEDVSAGAVAYAASQPGRGEGGRVDLLAFPGDTEEADAVAELVRRALADHADDGDFRAAIIVRARSHLKDLLPALKRLQVPFRAVKLDPLLSRPVVQDLLALTRVLLLPADTAALLAVLRAPFCGLRLVDLHAIAGDGRDPQDPQVLAHLDAEARGRAERVYQVLEDARSFWRRRPLRDLVEGAWLRLGGPNCYLHGATDTSDAAAYLSALDVAQAGGLLADWNDFLELLSGEFTEGDPPAPEVKLEILTMHGAKGLEWDLVVLPGLHRSPPGSRQELLHWLPFTAADGTERVLLAPLRNAEEKHNRPLVDLIRNEQNTRAAFEDNRLLYVATTRARERLVLTACLAENSRGEIRPDARSLLATLWPTTGAAFTAALAAGVTQQADTPAAVEELPPVALPDQSLRRVAADWYPPAAGTFRWSPALPAFERQTPVDFNWAGIDARRTGTVLHRLLERAGRLGIETIDAAERQRLLNRVPHLLRALGARGETLEENTDIVRSAFERTLDSATGRWMLSAKHAACACELAVSGVIDGRLVNAIVDRTFIDDQGVRWVIDYKSGYHAGADLDEFFAQEGERYRSQLLLYSRLFTQLEDREVQTALYLPRHDRLEPVKG
ncbi:MAG: UvrD-helicase domain-containing protein [Pseudomonadales bacterium]|nr:UvrD-helicase domain-containing protein [Pseudomonadales bacterium]